MAEIDYAIQNPVTDDELNALFRTAWEGHVDRPFAQILVRSLTYVCASDGKRLVGFVNIAWDGGIHGFVLDPTVHADYQRQGIGRRLIQEAVEVARKRGLQWLHVDFVPELKPFYDACGFRECAAGLLDLKKRD